MSKSRINNSVKNASISVFLQIITMIFMFGSRTIFVNFLGNDYLSVNGLFTNIITILSFTELGVGNAIIYSLYEPLSKGDERKITAFLNFYAKAYKIVIIVISFLGLSVIPFIGYIVSDVPNIKENITYIYVLFLINTVVSYIFSYKKSLLIADQKNYLVLIIQQFFYIIQLIFQIFFLFVTRNYIAFLLLQIIFTLFTNLVTTEYVNRKYGYIRRYKQSELNQSEKDALFSNIKSIFFYKLGAVILNGTDNIIISATLKTAFVGLCSNYTLIINAINSVLMQACNGIAASIGNHNIEASPERKEEVFNILILISYWVFGLASICLGILLNPFIELWIGKEYLLDTSVVNSLVLGFYLTGINQIPSLYRTSMGIFRQAKYTPIVAAVINLILSVILAKAIGLAGVFIATSISKILTFSIVDPVLVYKKGFKMDYRKYFSKFFMFFILLLISYYLVSFTVTLIDYPGLTGFIVKIIVCLVQVNAIFLLALFQTQSFKDLLVKFRKK